MERPSYNRPIPADEVLPSELREEISGVFRSAESFADFSKPHETAEQAVARIAESIALEPQAYEEISLEVLKKLRTLEQREAVVTREAQKSLLQTIRDWAHKHRMAATLVMAAGIHSPIVARSTSFIETIQHILKTASDWEKPGMVIYPQTQAERDAVVRQIYARGERADRKAAEAFQTNARDRMERGEPVSFSELYTNMEQTGGVPAEQVREAERNKEAMIERFAARMGGQMDETFIRSVVAEMFGPDENYVWGQGSVSDYFRTGKRNCVSIARAEHMVFEELIRRLPEDRRARYELGLAFEKQHQIATLTVKDAQGKPVQTYFLQPPMPSQRGGAERTGSPAVSMETIKQAAVSPRPVTVRSPVPEGEVIPPSPDIDVITDEPFSLNLHVQGPLRGSEYIEQIAEQHSIVPVHVPDMAREPMEFELLNDPRVQQAIDHIEAAYQYKEKHDPDETGGIYIKADLTKIPWKELSPDQINLIFLEFYRDRATGAYREMRPPDLIDLGDASDFSPEVLRHIVNLKDTEIAIELSYDENGAADYSNILRIGGHLNKQLQSGFKPEDLPTLLFKGPAIIKRLPYMLKTLEKGNFAFDMSIPKMGLWKTDQDLENAIITSKANELYLEGMFFTSRGLQQLIDHPNKTYHLGLSTYLSVICQRPDVLKAEHIKPWINKILSTDEIDEMEKAVSPEVWQKVFPAIEKLHDQSIAKFYKGFYGKLDQTDQSR